MCEAGLLLCAPFVGTPGIVVLVFEASEGRLRLGGWILHPRVARVVPDAATTKEPS